MEAGSAAVFRLPLLLAVVLIGLGLLGMQGLQHARDSLEAKEAGGDAPASQARAKPGSADAVRGNGLRIPVSRDGHFYVEGFVGSARMRFLVDTGASAVALAREHAWDLGIGLNPSDFTMAVRTANGVARAAPIVLDSVRIAGHRVRNVRALVIDAEMPAPLLGMSYLRRLSNFEMTDRALTLYWN